MDPVNGSISHSEGQAYAMLLSVHMDDRRTFEQVWYWTQHKLQTREDALFSWKWHPDKGVMDANNATDADLIIAWSLSLAATKWQMPVYEQASFHIRQSIIEKLLYSYDGLTLLLPGEQGFLTEESVALNLSYWVYPALNHFAQRNKRFAELRESGLILLRQAKFGYWQLPADWILLSFESEGSLEPWAQSSQRYGYDAVRIPLYLKWAGYQSPELLEPYKKFVQSFCPFELLPDWVDLSEQVVHMNPASTGMRTIYHYLFGEAVQSCRFNQQVVESSYYSDVLALLVQTAEHVSVVR